MRVKYSEKFAYSTPDKTSVCWTCAKVSWRMCSTENFGSRVAELQKPSRFHFVLQVNARNAVPYSRGAKLNIDLHFFIGSFMSELAPSTLQYAADNNAPEGKLKVDRTLLWALHQDPLLVPSFRKRLPSRSTSETGSYDSGMMINCVKVVVLEAGWSMHPTSAPWLFE